MNSKNITAVVLSVINIVASLLFVPIWVEYVHAIFTNQMSRLESNNILADSVVMLLSLIFISASIIVIIKYSRNKKISIVIPGVIFGIYLIVFGVIFFVS